MKKLLLITLLLVSLGGGVWFITQKPEAKTRLPETSTPTPAVSSTPVGVESVEFKPFQPKSLRIPDLGVEATVEHVGLDKDQRMDVPKNFNNVAWYKLGPQIGQQGSAVIAGHFDNPDGTPSVFYNLANLKRGDEIEVIGTNGRGATYVVESIATYEDAAFPLSLVFERDDAKRLNLITCSGSFSASQQNYSHRLVAFTVLKE